MEQAAENRQEVGGMKRGRKPKAEAAEVQPQGEQVQAESVPDAQAIAERIFAGQSPDLSRNIRLARVAAGLESIGLSMDGVKL